MAPKGQNFTPVFYDIETTGLSRNSTYLYLIGAVGIEDETWYFYQWMAENASEEETILRIFSQFLQQYNLMISYNGERFDQPYLEARYEKYGIPSPFTGKQSLNLYLILKPLEPVSIMSGAVLGSPFFHCNSNGVGNIKFKVCTALDCFL